MTLPAGDVVILQQVLAMVVADRQRISFWGAAARGSAIVTRWQSTELREQAVAARTGAKALRESCMRLRRELGCETAATPEVIAEPPFGSFR